MGKCLKTMFMFWFWPSLIGLWGWITTEQRFYKNKLTNNVCLVVVCDFNECINTKLELLQNDFVETIMLIIQRSQLILDFNEFINIKLELLQNDLVAENIKLILMIRLQMVLETGMSALRTAAVKPRLKPWLDGFVTVPHNINEEQFAEYEANDPFVQVQWTYHMFELWLILKIRLVWVLCTQWRQRIFLRPLFLAGRVSQCYI